MVLKEEERKAIYALNYLNFLVYYYADGEMGQNELSTVLEKFSKWSLKGRFGNHDEAMAYFSGEGHQTVLSNAVGWATDKNKIMHELGVQADILYDYFSGQYEDLLSLVNDFSAIANADGVVTESEKSMVDNIASRWNISSNIKQTHSIGSSRQSPGQIGLLYDTKDWKAGVVEWERGKEAHARIHSNTTTLNQRYRNPEVPRGYEYVCIYVKAVRTGGNDAPETIRDWCWNLLGNRMSLHSECRSLLATPEPEFKGELYPGGSVEGWVTLTCFSGESNLMAIFDPPNCHFDGRDKIFISLK